MAFIFWNCSHGMMAKIDLIAYYISKLSPEIFFVSEAELKPNKNYSCLAVPGYDLEVSKTLGSGGGMARQAAYVRTNSPFKRQPSLEDGESETMVFTDNKTRVCGVYRPFKPPPNRTSGEAFTLLLSNLERISSSGIDVVICGDFNVDWMSESTNKRRLETWAESSGLLQAINQKTRHQEVSTDDGMVVKESCIDLLFQLWPRKFEVLPAIGSDHDLILVSNDVKKKRTSVQTRKLVSIDWRNYLPETVAKDLQESLETSHITSASKILDTINGTLITVLNEWAPKRVVRLRGDNEFENCHIEAIKKRRDRAIKKFKKTGNLYQYLKAKSLTKCMKRVIKKERRRVFRAKMQSHGSQSFWRTVGAVFNETSQKDDLFLTIEGQRTQDKRQIAEEFGSYFTKKIDALVEGSMVVEPPDCPSSSPERRADWVEFTHEEVSKAIKESKNKRSSGPDEIPMCIIKDCAEVLTTHLRKLFNRCMLENWYPDEWKIARVTPIHKKGRKDQVENYRPVSNLSSISKIFERCVLHRINKHFEEDRSQHGFRHGHSTVSAGLEIQSSLAKNLDNKKVTAMYSLDMSAAFDLLRHNLLSSQLSQSVLPTPLCMILSEFLRNRKAYVEVEGEQSSIFELPTGVPQGSVLGPKLFSIYTNGLAKFLESDSVRAVIYADDAYVVCSATDEAQLVSLMESTMTRHIRWLREKGMVVNANKTEVLYMNTSKYISLCVEGTSLMSSDSMMVLGVEFDRALSWEKQLHRAKMACQRMKPALRMLRTRLHRKEFLQVITSYYYPRLYYASEIWYHPLRRALKDTLNPFHHYPLRLAIGDFKKEKSNKLVLHLTDRASPFEYNNFKIAKLLISIVNRTDPFLLYQDLLSQAVIERRNPSRPWFLDMSRCKIGRQAFPNRISVISKSISFKWLGKHLSKDALRSNLKKCFFTANLA